MVKSVEQLKERKELLENELDRLTEMYAEILRMRETGVLCSEMKSTIQEYRSIIENLEDQIKSYE